MLASDDKIDLKMGKSETNILIKQHLLLTL